MQVEEMVERVWPGRERADRGARRRDHEPELQGHARRRRLRAPDRRQGHGAARDRPARRVRGVARRGGRRRRAGGGRLRRAGGLSRHPLHRWRGGRARGDPGGRGAPTRRAVAPRRARGPADRGALRLVPRRRGLRRHRHDARDHRSAGVRACARDGRARRAGARPGAGAPVPQRSAHRQLHRRRRPDPDRRLGVRGDGRRLLRPGEPRGQQRPLRRGRQPRSCAPTSATSAPSTSAR